MLVTGTLISAASIFEWQRLVRVINAKLDKQQTPGALRRWSSSLCSGSPSLRGDLW